MMSVEFLSEVNKTNFLVNLHTVPSVPACVGWDDATIMQHPMGKSVGQVELDQWDMLVQQTFSKQK